MSTELDDFEVNERGPRPGFLTVLCVLSFISTGLGFISGLFSFISGPSSDEELLDAKVQMAKSVGDLKDVGMDSFARIMEQLEAMTVEINNSFYLASTITLITVALGLFGVIKMWQGFKLGFHLYIVYCLFSIASMYIYVSPGNIPTIIVVFNLLFSALFIFLYSRNLKWLR